MLPDTSAAPVILRLEADPRDADRVIVTIGPADAGPSLAHTLGLHIAVVAREALRVGLPCPPAREAALRAGDQFQQHYTRALAFLAVRPRSEAEVRRRLREKAVPPDDIDAVVARLQRAGYLDDREFARYWITERARSSPRGARLLRGELRNKGVAPAIIDAALAAFEADATATEEAPPPPDSDPNPAEDAEDTAPLQEESRVVREALAMARRRQRSYAHLDPATFRRRMSGFLLRRGYEYAVVSRVLKHLQPE